MISPKDQKIDVALKADGSRRPSFIGRSWGVIRALVKIVQFNGGIINTIASVLSFISLEGIKGARTRVVAVLHSEKRNDYSEWIRRYDTLSEESRQQIRGQISNMANKPLISIIMPTYNSNIVWLIEAIDSVHKQLYANWELCIADDNSSDTRVRQFLEGVSKEDERIKVVFREKNGHISRASNSALALCSGEWVALIDHDDTLAEHALFCVAEVICRNPSVRLIYSDEDKINVEGHRTDPYFKCDWNLDLFYSHNMISHLGVYKKEIVQEIGGFREGFEGSQDYDLALRYIERIDQKSIHHIPRVLYHWRAHENSTALSATAKPYAMTAAQKALQQHFDRRRISAKVEQDSTAFRVSYSLPAPEPLVSLIIPTRNGLDLLKQCLTSIREKTTYKNYELLVVDNGSDDPQIIEYFSNLRRQDNIRILRDDGPFNYSSINNSAVAKAKGEIIGLVNNDIRVISPEWLTEMVSIAVQPGIGAVGAKLLFPDDTLQHAGVVLGIGGVANHAFKCLPGNTGGYFGRANFLSSYSAVTAACLIIQKNIFQQHRGFDEENLTTAYGDVDLCLRVRESGYRNVWTPYALLYHSESASRGYEDTPEKQARFESEFNYMKKRWSQQLLNDPAYSPNLTLEDVDFSLAWPPRLDLLDGTHSSPEGLRQ